MSPHTSDDPVVGAIYNGSKVVKIDEERSKRPNGLTRVRRAIQLASGMILVEDKFIDEGPAIQGEYKEIEFLSIPSPDLSIKGSVRPKLKDKKHKKKFKIPSLDSEDDDETLVQEKRKGSKEKTEEAEDMARRAAEEEAERKRKEERDLKEAQEQSRIQQEEELKAKREADELARRQEEDRKRQELEDAEREAERLRKEAADDRLRASQEATRKRKEEADARKRKKEAEEKKRKQEAEARRAEEQRKAAIVDNWKPKTVWVHSPESKVQRKDKDQSLDSVVPQAIWSYGSNPEPDKNFNWWRPQQVVVHPPGKDPPSDRQKDESPRGIWAYASGARPDEDDGEWFPKGLTSGPAVIVFPPGIHPTAVNSQELTAIGTWTYPAGDRSSFPPLPIPKNDSGPTLVTVHPLSKLPDKMNGDGVRGQWMVHDGKETRPAGDQSWRIMDVQVYPDGKEPQAPSNEEIHGMWGLAPGAKPNEQGEWSPSDMWFFGPGEATPHDDAWTPQGIWTQSPDDERSAWPPVSEPQDDWEPRAVWVFPQSNLPDENDEEWKPTGVWSFGTGEAAEDSDDWAPCQVMAYPFGKEPTDLEDAKIRGVWGLSPSAIRDDDEDWKPSDMLFVGPGDTPPEDWRPQGVWILSPSGNHEADIEDWPPKRHSTKKEPRVEWEPRAVWVFPQSNLPDENDEEWKPTGVWSFGAGDAAEDTDDWAPCQVMAYPFGKEPTDLEDAKIRGVWGLSPSAIRDDDEDWKPSDVLFVGPGDTPPEDWTPQGVWILSPSDNREADSEDWPPKRRTARKVPHDIVESSSSASKPTTSVPAGPSIGSNGTTPSQAWVYPKKKAPKDVEKGVRRGVWSYKPGKKVMDSGKKPTLVDLYESGQEPPHLPSEHGVWGYAPTAEPTSDGQFLPSDMWIFAPGETPPNDDEWQRRGIWTVPSPEPKQKPKISRKKSSQETKKEKPKKQLERRFEKSVWVYPSKDKTPEKAEKKNPQGCWAHPSTSSDGDEPNEILIHPKGHTLKDMAKVPHGIFGYVPGSKPDDDGLWSPQDMLFFPPGEDPPPGLQNEGIWSYPHGSRIEIMYSYTFEGNDIVNLKKTTIFYMDTSITFTKEYIE